MKFATILKNLRKDRRMTQDELSKLLNVAKSTVSMYEQGERMPSFEIMESLADIFNVSIDVLYGRETESTKTEKPADEGELTEEVVIYHRDGKTVRRKFSKEQLKMISAMLDAIPDDPDDNAGL